MAQVETVKVQREKSDANPTGVVIINKEDFDEKVDKLYVEEEAAPPAPVPKVDPVTPAAKADPAASTDSAASTDTSATGDKKPWDK